MRTYQAVHVPQHSAAWRRMILERDLRAEGRELAEELRVAHQRVLDTRKEYADVHSMVVEQVQDYRSAIAMLSGDLLAVYNFIDEWTERTARDGKYARGQRIVLEHLSKVISLPLMAELTAAEQQAESFDGIWQSDNGEWEIAVSDGLGDEEWRDDDLAQFEVPEDDIRYLHEDAQ